MTLPVERVYALLNTREFLWSLLDRSATPGIPKDIRKQAYWCLKHFPGEVDLRSAAESAPEVFEWPTSKDS
jgi:hypothetical protein